MLERLYFGSANILVLRAFLLGVLQKCLQVILFKRKNRSLRLCQRSFVCQCFLKHHGQLENKYMGKMLPLNRQYDGHAPSPGKYGRRPAVLRAELRSRTLSYLLCLLTLAVKSGWLFSLDHSAAFQASCTFHQFIHTQRKHSACGWINLTFFLDL